MPRSSRVAPQAPHRCLQPRRFALLLAGATLALAWPLAATAQDGDASVQQQQQQQAVDPLLRATPDGPPVPAIAAPAPTAGDQIAFEADAVEYANEADTVTATGTICLPSSGSSTSSVRSVFPAASRRR